MTYQYTHWDDPADKLSAAGRITDVVRRDVVNETGLSASAGIERVDYTRVSDKTTRSGYVLWMSNNVDEVVYTWVTGTLTNFSAARLLKRTYIYTSILRDLIKRGLTW